MNYQYFCLLNQWAGRTDAVDDIMEFTATWLIYATFTVTAVLTAVELYHRRTRAVIEVGVASAVAFASAMLVAHVSHEARPFQTHQVHQLISHDPGVSMPSDHATAAFTLALAVGVFVHRRWGVVLGAVAVAIGVSRVWVGVHYPADIIAAAMIAALSVLAVALWSRWRRANDPADLPATIARP